MHSQALVNKVLIDLGSSKVYNLLSYLVGIALIAAAAKVIIPLPWTPVPITGQTFGVTLIALLWGQKRAFAIVSSYLILGLLGMPVFAIAAGSTWGYLVGMLLSTLVVGHLSDKGFTNTFLKTYVAAFLGSCIVFTCGLTVLSFFIPFERLFMAGLIPFLPGDVIKTVTAVGIAHSLNQMKK